MFQIINLVMFGMFDTINFRLIAPDPLSTNYLDYVPNYLENQAEHNYENGVSVTGLLDGLRVSVSRHKVSIKDGSLCKWYLGNNIQIMTRQDTRQAIEKLSDAIHLPMDRAVITRLDIAQNIITKHPVNTYLNHFGMLRYATRLPMPHGLYYQRGDRQVCFYDKIREQRAKNEPIPELYNGKSVLRYEQRYMRRLSSYFKTDVTGAMLYDEDFYINAINKWYSMYDEINKINDVIFNFYAMTTISDFKNMGLLALIEQMGGEVEFYNQIREAMQRGELTHKQAYDIRQAIKKAGKIKADLVVKNDAIAELDNKVKQAVKFYR